MTTKLRGAAVLVLFALVPSAALADVDATRTVSVSGGSNSTWNLRDDLADRCLAPSETGFGVVNAAFGSGSDRLSDALDGGHFVSVDGRIFDDSDGLVERSGSSVKAGPEQLSGLGVTVTHTALGRNATMRTLVGLRNTSAETKTRTIAVRTNGAGGAAEDTVATSDGDRMVEGRDRWAVWTPGASKPGVATKVSGLAGPFVKRVSVGSVKQQPGDSDGSKSCLWVNYRVTVPPGATRHLLFFTRLTDSARSGVSAATHFTNEKSYLFKGMTSAERTQSVNWSLFGRVPAGVDWAAFDKQKADVSDCTPVNPEDCVVFAASSENRPRIHLFGDSHARMFIPAFTRFARRHDFTLSAGVRLGCAWQRNLFADEPKAIYRTRCTEFHDNQYQVIEDTQPDVVVGITAPRDDPQGAPSGVRWAGGVDAFRRKTNAAVAELTPAHRVVLLEHVPFWSIKPLQCLEDSTKVARCAIGATPSPLRSEAVLRRADRDRERVFSVDPDPIVCPYLPVCVPIVKGDVAWRNGSHIVPTFSDTIGMQVYRALRDRGVFTGL